MDKFYNETYLKLETAIQELEIETDCSIKRIEAVIELIIQSLADLKEFVLKHDFKNMEEEIHFFKHQETCYLLQSSFTIMPSIKSKPKNPNGTKPIRKYLNEEFSKLQTVI